LRIIFCVCLLSLCLPVSLYSAQSYFLILNRPFNVSAKGSVSSSKLAAAVSTQFDIKGIHNITLFHFFPAVSNAVVPVTVMGGQSIDTGSDKYIYKLTVADDALEDVKDRFKQLDSYIHFQPNYEYKLAAFTDQATDTGSYSKQSEYLEFMKFPNFWEYATGNGVVVAVLDTGILMNHVEFCDDSKSNETTNCDDLDASKSNLVHPKGFPSDEETFSSTLTKIDNEDYEDTDNIPLDIDGHGTKVSGVIAAQLNTEVEDGSGNSFGIVGAAYGASIMPLKVMYSYYHTIKKKNVTRGYTDSIVKAINYAVLNNADIINMSLGGVLDQESDFVMETAVNAAVAAGTLVVAASGNDAINIDTSKTAPASFYNVMSVGAANYNNISESYSNYGESLDIVAYGGRIPGESRGVYSSTSVTYNAFEFIEGTSFAAPFVSALAALIQSYHKQRYNGEKMSPQDLRELINRSADRTTQAKSLTLGHGMINAEKVLFYLGKLDSESLSVPFEGSTGNYSNLLCYPNPFNLQQTSSTSCKFFTSKTGEVEVSVYSRRGQRVYSAMESLSPHEFSFNWNGLDENGHEKLPNGVYQLMLHIVYDDGSPSLIKKHLITLLN
jgi:subtilisin family serine protease